MAEFADGFNRDGDTPMTQVPSCVLTEASVDQASVDFVREGCLILEGFISPATVDRVRALHRLRHEQHGDLPALKVGDGRRMTPVEVSDEMHNPSIFAAPPLLALLRTLLGDDMVLSVFTSVTSRAGAGDQHRHRDSIGLFNNPIDRLCPSFAINLFVPLVDLSPSTGATRVWPGSHRSLGTPDELSNSDAVLPLLDRGSAMLLDYRVVHQGTANRSSEFRPVLNLAYTRRWFLDTHHFNDVPSLNVPADELSRMDPGIRALFPFVDDT